jgi:hypothetical protein
MDSESRSSSLSNGDASFRADALVPPAVDFESLRRVLAEFIIARDDSMPIR